MRSMAAACISPEVAESMLLELNYRWILHRSINNRGLDPSIGGFHDQHLIEAVQKMNWTLFGKATYTDWIHTGAFADTGERSGLKKNELRGGPRDENLSSDVSSVVDECVQLGLSSSAARLGQMQGVQIPAASVSTKPEHDKFELMWRGFVAPSEMLLLDFSAFAIAWNHDVQQIEDGLTPWEHVYRKTESHLESYWKKHNGEVNQWETLRGLDRITGRLREPIDVQGAAALPGEAWLLQAHSETRQMDIPHEVGDGAYATPEVDTQESASDKKRTRSPQHCGTCGHLL